MPSIVCKWVQLWLKGQPSCSEKRLQRGRSGLGGLKRCWESVARRIPSTARHWRWAPPGERLYPDWSGPTGADMLHLEPEMTTLKWSVSETINQLGLIWANIVHPNFKSMWNHPNLVKYGIFTSLLQVPGNGLKQVTCLRSWADSASKMSLTAILLQPCQRGFANITFVELAGAAVHKWYRWATRKHSAVNKKSMTLHGPWTRKQGGGTIRILFALIPSSKNMSPSLGCVKLKGLNSWENKSERHGQFRWNSMKVLFI